MYKHSLFISWTALLVVIAILHILAIEFYLYWIYSWFDVMMHFLGGLFVASFALWFFFESRYVGLYKSMRHIVLVAGGSIILVGTSWEMFELLTRIPTEENFALDTTIDLVMDVLGALVAGFVFTKIYISKEHKETEVTSIGGGTIGREQL